MKHKSETFHRNPKSPEIVQFGGQIEMASETNILALIECQVYNLFHL